LLLFYKPLHLEAQQVSTRIEVRRHQMPVTIKGRGHPKMTEETDTVVKGGDPATMTITVLIVK
jgi:hypothetical protein